MSLIEFIILNNLHIETFMFEEINVLGTKFFEKL